MKRNVFLCVLILPLVLAGCTTTDLLGSFNLISPAEEQQLGDNLAGEIASQRTLIDDDTVAPYVRAIGQRLVDVSPTPGATYQFYVIEDESINAFAIPGGYMYMHTGLILASQTEDELASVIAHELAHAVKRHPTQRMSRQMGAQTIASLILGEDPGQLSQIASQLILAGGISAYSRSAELEADRMAVDLLHEAGYNPNGLVSFFSTLVVLEQQAGGTRGASLFATHPPTPDRINAAQLRIGNLAAMRASKPPVGDLQQIQASLEQLVSSR